MTRAPANSRDLIHRTLLVAGTALFALLVVALVAYLVHFLLLVFAGVLVAVLLNGLARWLGRHAGLSYPVSLAAVLLLLTGLGALAGWLVGPQLAVQFGLLLQEMPAALERVRSQLASTDWGTALVKDASRALPQIVLGGSLWGKISGVFSLVLGGFAGALIILFTGVYLAADPALYIDNALRLVPPRQRSRAHEVVQAVGCALRAWMAGRFVAMLSLGLLTTATLLVFGVPLAVPLGVIAAILFFVPYVGAFLSAVPAMLVGLATSPSRTLEIGLLYLGIHIIEGYVVTPLVQRKAVSMPPALLLVAQIFMGMVGGVSGVLLATPLLVVIIVLVQLLYVQDALGEPVTALGDRHG